MDKKGVSAVAESNVRFSRRKAFATLYREVAQDTRLSLESRGLLLLMASLPEDWSYSVAGLAKKAGCGKDKLRRILGELEDVGYLAREQCHDAGGKFSGNMYVIQDDAPPLSGKPDNGETRQRFFPSSGNPTEHNKESTVEENKEPPIVPHEGDELAGKKKRDPAVPKYRPDLFERFWGKYPLREGRRSPRSKAVRAWDKLKPDMELCFAMSAALDRQNWPESWRREDGRYIPLASTWLTDIRENGLELPVRDPPAPPPPKRRAYHMEEIDGEEVIVYDN